MTRKINTWSIDTDGNGTELTADFGPEDFERWWLAGMDRDDRIDDDARAEMLDAMLYLAEAENRRMVQTVADLRAAIGDWADEWNQIA